MYLYCLDCDGNVTIMWIKFEFFLKRNKKKLYIYMHCNTYQFNQNLHFSSHQTSMYRYTDYHEIWKYCFKTTTVNAQIGICDLINFVAGLISMSRMRIDLI